jgi:putative nucleotidyltransferase with HDIG domain
VTTRIVFVDDEVNILHAMRRTFHHMREEWSMDFVASGAAALESLAKMPADVIVSDMRMPGMNGWQLLAEVKRLYPHTVRLVLSGQADANTVMRAVGTAQVYLAKPCESDALKAAIKQTQALRQLLSSEQLAALVGGVGMLPSVPIVFQELLCCLQDPCASLTDAAKIIGRDVAMTANIMKLVNSAFFGSRRSITTTDRAVAYLGMDTLGALVLAHSVFKSDITTGIPEFSLEELWQHSLQTGTSARAIALCQDFSAAQAEEVFLAGVLHDVGKVVFASCAVALPYGSTGTVADVAAQMESHHAEVGAYLLGLWGFPNPIVDAVAFHHAPSHASTQQLSGAGVIHIADRLIHMRDGETSALTDGLEPGYLESLGLSHCLAKWTMAVNAMDERKAVG